MLDLWLIRHGETWWRLEQRTQGHSQNSLSDRGQAQARRLGQRLCGVAFTHVYSSDLRRAFQTASLALPGESLELDVRLRELAGGYLEGKTKEELTERERAAYDAWRNDPYRLKRGGAESLADLRARVLAWLQDLPPEGRVATFTHGGVIRAVLYGLLGLRHTPDLDIKTHYTGITRVYLTSVQKVIVSVNDAGHLHDLQAEG